MNRFKALSAARRSSRFFSFGDSLQRGGANCPPLYLESRNTSESERAMCGFSEIEIPESIINLMCRGSSVFSSPTVL